MFSKQLTVFVAVFIVALSIFIATPVSAIYYDGCDVIASSPNGNNLNTTSQKGFYGNFSWQAGETIYWDLSAGPRTNSTNTTVYVAIYDGSYVIVNQVASSGETVSSNSSHTFSTSGNYFVYIFAQDQSATTPVLSARVSCSSFGSAGTKSETGENIVYPPDDRINWQNGDTNAVAYSVDDMGQNPALHLYCWDEENKVSWLGFAITQETVANLTATSENQLVAEIHNDPCHAEFWLLADGQYQLNIYGDNGKIYEMLDWDLNFRDAESRYFDPNE